MIKERLPGGSSKEVTKAGQGKESQSSGDMDLGKVPETSCSLIPQEGSAPKVRGIIFILVTGQGLFQEDKLPGMSGFLCLQMRWSHSLGQFSQEEAHMQAIGSKNTKPGRDAQER